MVSIFRLPSAVETSVAFGKNCADSCYDCNLLIITTSTATASATSAKTSVKTAAKTAKAA
jgi:hypothetical protein